MKIINLKEFLEQIKPLETPLFIKNNRIGGHATKVGKRMGYEVK